MTEINEKLFVAPPPLITPINLLFFVKKISTDEKNSIPEQRKNIEVLILSSSYNELFCKDLIFTLQNNHFVEGPTETSHHPKKIDILFEDLAETENRAKIVLEGLDLEGLKQDVKESKTLINVNLLCYQ